MLIYTTIKKKSGYRRSKYITETKCNHRLSEEGSKSCERYVTLKELTIVYCCYQLKTKQ